MKSSRIKHIALLLYKKLQQLLDSITLSFDAAAIHEFRITYKKLRAFLRMLSLQNNNKKTITIPAKLKKLYSLLGSIRDLQLQQQRIVASRKNIKTFTPCIHLLQQQMDILKPQLLDLASKKPVAKSKNNIAKKLPEKFSRQSFKKFVRQKYQAINTIVAAGNFSDANIHTIRKHLKDLLYNLKADEAFKKWWPAIPVWKEKDAAFFTGLMEELGIFQDKCTAINLLLPCWINQLSVQEQLPLKFLQQIWTTEKLLIKKSLLAKLNTHFSTASAGSK
jgi:CHAD domain-containing protein